LTPQTHFVDVDDDDDMAGEDEDDARVATVKLRGRFSCPHLFCGQTSLWQVLNSLDILFLWLVIVFDGNVLDMKALFGHICSLMSIKRGRDREICQKLQNHNPWLLTSGRL